MEKEYDDEENFEDDKFADFEGFDDTCPHCGSDEVQEIDRWFGVDILPRLKAGDSCR